jgi:hypothetical protein
MLPISLMISPGSRNKIHCLEISQYDKFL